MEQQADPSLIPLVRELYSKRYTLLLVSLICAVVSGLAALLRPTHGYEIVVRVGGIRSDATLVDADELALKLKSEAEILRMTRLNPLFEGTLSSTIAADGETIAAKDFQQATLGYKNDRPKYLVLEHTVQSSNKRVAYEIAARLKEVIAKNHGQRFARVIKQAQQELRNQEALLVRMEKRAALRTVHNDDQPPENESWRGVLELSREIHKRKAQLGHWGTRPTAIFGPNYVSSGAKALAISVVVGAGAGFALLTGLIALSYFIRRFAL